MSTELDRLEKTMRKLVNLLTLRDEVAKMAWPPGAPYCAKLVEALNATLDEPYSLDVVTEPVEPTGAELVGKVCEFSHDGKTWTRSVCICYAPGEFDGHPYESRMSGWYRYARLYREDRK